MTIAFCTSLTDESLRAVGENCQKLEKLDMQVHNKEKTETPITESTCAEEKENVGEDKLDGASKSDETATGSSKQDMASENSEENTGADVENKDDTMTTTNNFKCSRGLKNLTIAFCTSLTDESLFLNLNSPDKTFLFFILLNLSAPEFKFYSWYTGAGAVFTAHVLLAR